MESIRFSTPPLKSSGHWWHIQSCQFAYCRKDQQSSKWCQKARGAVSSQGMTRRCINCKIQISAGLLETCEVNAPVCIECLLQKLICLVRQQIVSLCISTWLMLQHPKQHIRCKSTLTWFLEEKNALGLGLILHTISNSSRKAALLEVARKRSQESRLQPCSAAIPMCWIVSTDTSK